MTIREFLKESSIDFENRDRYEEKSIEILNEGSVVIELEDHEDVSVEGFKKIIAGLKQDLNYDGSDIEGEWWWAASPIEQLISFLDMFDSNGDLNQPMLTEVESVPAKKSFWQRIFGK